MPRKEIGFAPLTLTAVGSLEPLSKLADALVLQWHGEAFDSPARADNLAATNACATQAFALGSTLLGLQFHPETDELPNFERWTIGHSVELAQAGIDPASLRRDAGTHGASLRCAGQSMLRTSLQDLPT